MFIVLNEGSCLIQIFTSEVRFKIFDLFKNYRDTVFPNNNSFHFNTAYLRVPLVRTNV